MGVLGTIVCEFRYTAEFTRVCTSRRLMMAAQFKGLAQPRSHLGGLWRRRERRERSRVLALLRSRLDALRSCTVTGAYFI
jgi:hypothetical protein